MERKDSRCEERVKTNRFLAGCDELGGETLSPESQNLTQYIQRLERTTTAFEEVGPSKEFCNVSTKWEINDQSAGSSQNNTEGRVALDRLNLSQRAHSKTTQTPQTPCNLKEHCCTPASSGTGQTDGFRAFSGRGGQHEESPAISSSFHATHQSVVSRDPRLPHAENGSQQGFDQDYFDPQISAFSTDEALAASALMELSRDGSWLKPETASCETRVSFDDVKKLLHLPIREAALALRVGVPEIKRLCEQNGIQQWLTIKTKSMKQLLKDFPGSHDRGVLGWGKAKRSRSGATKRKASKDSTQKRDTKEDTCYIGTVSEEKRVRRRTNRTVNGGVDHLQSAPSIDLGIEAAQSMELQMHDSAQTVDRQNSGPSVGVIQEGVTN